jgi:FMN phosphatase YigB (HAD superfamily)
MSNPELRALLLDLDDTLISCPMDTFLPGYFGAIGEFMAELVPSDVFLPALMAASRVMNKNDGGPRSNEEVFAEAFYPLLPAPEAEVRARAERFYREGYPALRELITPRAAAPRIIEWALSRGLDVVVATNPMFPRTAIEQRLQWGDIDTQGIAWVTWMENCHATKSSPAYYRGILERIGRAPSEALMVGDNWAADIVCSDAAGVAGYWIGEQSAPTPAPDVPLVGRGTVDTFLAALEDGTLSSRWAESARARR